MADSMTLPSCVKLHTQRSYLIGRSFTPCKSRYRIEQRSLDYRRIGSCVISGRIAFCLRRFEKCDNGNYARHRISTWKGCGFGGRYVLKLKQDPRLKENFTYSNCLLPLVNTDGATASDWVPVVDQMLLLASVILTYTAGILPGRRSYQPGGNISDKSANSECSTFTGSALKTDDQLSSKFAMDLVREKILNCLDAFERGYNLGKTVLEFDKQLDNQPLSLSAIAEGPRLRLLWASIRQIEEEVNNFSIAKIEDGNQLLQVLPRFIQKSVRPICMAWLKSELCLNKSDLDEVIVSGIFEKIREDDNVLQNIRKSGKENLYEELLQFLSLGYLREGSYYDPGLFRMHGTSILEDLVIHLADGIASMYLELISVDSSFSNEINSLALDLCTLSTRALQRLRNEVVMKQWLYQNVDAIVSMYEDRFDLCTLDSQLIEVEGRETQNNTWWGRVNLGKSKTMSSKMQCVVIRRFSMPVKRTKELRALIGWRYYFSLFIELSDITMPLIRAVIEKISSAISFFLVSLIGRSLGLIYTGIRQSLRWK